jgi:hypothetical protein
MKRFATAPLIVVALALALFPPALNAQTCGGTERWPVKVGTDSGVARVDLSTQIPKGVPEMLALPEPQRPPKNDNDTRLNEETHVYAVTGHLIQFKLESGDGGDEDYHMVVSDDTLLFTNERKGKPPGHSLVAEIPNPDCIAGQEGDPAVQSRFSDAIRNSRHALESQFPNIDTSGNFNDAGGIAVCIVGVGFFDFPHKQVGRATNNVEIHPVLNISFSPCSDNTVPSPSNPTSPTTGTAATVKHTVRLHPDPSARSSVIRTLAVGTTLTIVNATPQNGFLHVTTAEGEQGWVWSKFINLGSP